MQNILDILNEYSKKHLFVDEDFIKLVINYYVKYNNLNDFVKDLVFNIDEVNIAFQNYVNNNFICKLLNIDHTSSFPQDNNSFMQYMKNPRIIYANMSIINYETLHAYFKDFTKDIVSSPYDIYLFYNSIVLVMIFHELNHAKQHKDVQDKKNNSFEKQLLNIPFWTDNILNSKFDFIKVILKNGVNSLEEIEKIQQIEKIYYGILPSEHLANYYAQEEVISLLSNLDNASNVLKKLKIYDLYMNLSGYTKENEYAPTNKYLNIIDNNLSISKKMINKKFLKNLKDELKSNYENRLKLGLYLSSNEINEYKRKVLL